MRKEEIVVLLSEYKKQSIINKANNMNLSVNQFMLLAAKEYNPQEEGIILEIFEKISHSIASSIDDALLHVKESNSRIEDMEKNKLLNTVSVQLKEAINSTKLVNQHLDSALKKSGEKSS